MKSLFILLLSAVMNLSGLAAVSASEKNENYEISKNTQFGGRELEAVYRINYTNTGAKLKRHFEVIKTDEKLKAFFLADFLLIERKNGLILYYPLGWVTGLIKITEIKANCKAVVSGEVSPVEIG